jgi:hypothetical protein
VRRNTFLVVCGGPWGANEWFSLNRVYPRRGWLVFSREGRATLLVFIWDIALVFWCHLWNKGSFRTKKDWIDPSTILNWYPLLSYPFSWSWLSFPWMLDHDMIHVGSRRVAYIIMHNGIVVGVPKRTITSSTPINLCSLTSGGWRGAAGLQRLAPLVASRRVWANLWQNVTFLADVDRPPHPTYSSLEAFINNKIWLHWI